MWERPTALWSRLKLGREEYLQRLVTTLIFDGVAPPWNTPRSPSDAGRTFLRLLDQAAHGVKDKHQSVAPPEAFVDEYLLPKVDESAANGWPDWAVLWSDRIWIIELKTEAGSHRVDQLPYYLRLAAAAHPSCSLDLTYITGPLAKPAPTLLDGQRYSHLTWEQVVPLVHAAWDHDARPEVVAHVEMVATLVSNLSRLKPSAQREIVLNSRTAGPSGEPGDVPANAVPAQDTGGSKPEPANATEPPVLLDLARATADDGRQRAVGAQNPEELETLRDMAVATIRILPLEDVTRFVLPWLWDGSRAGGKALTPEGNEFGYELRFSRYKKMQIST